MSFSSLPRPSLATLAFSPTRSDHLGFPLPSLRRPHRFGIACAIIGALLGAWLLPGPARAIIAREQVAPPSSVTILDRADMLSAANRQHIDSLRLFAPANLVVITGGDEILTDTGPTGVNEPFIRTEILPERAPSILKDPGAAAPMLKNNAVVLVLHAGEPYAGAVLPHNYGNLLGPFDRLTLLSTLREDYAQAANEDPQQALDTALTTLAWHIHAPAPAAYQWGWIGAAAGSLLGYLIGRIRPTAGGRRQLLRRLHNLPRPVLYALLDEPYHRRANGRLERFQEAVTDTRRSASSLPTRELSSRVRMLERQYALLAGLVAIHAGHGERAMLAELNCAGAMGAEEKSVRAARALLEDGDLAGELLLDEQAESLAAGGDDRLARLRLLGDMPGV